MFLYVSRFGFNFPYLFHKLSKILLAPLFWELLHVGNIVLSMNDWILFIYRVNLLDEPCINFKYLG